jgi:hypothetical protein
MSVSDQDLFLASAALSLANSFLVLGIIGTCLSVGHRGISGFHIPQVGSGQARQRLCRSFPAFHVETIERYVELN